MPDAELAELLERQAYKQVEARCRDLLHEQPNHVRVAFRLSQALWYQKRHHEAIELAYAANALDPGELELSVFLATALTDLGKRKQAVAIYRRTLEHHPSNPALLTLIGNVLSELREFPDAIAHHERAVEIAPAFAEAWANLSSTLLAASQPLLALKAAEKALQLKPEEAELHYNLGIIHLALSQHAQAEAYFRRALLLKPDHVGAHNNLGAALKEQKRFREAILAYSDALTFEPEHADAHWNLGLTFLQVGAYLEGFREYEWRRRIPDIKIRQFNAPAWDGSEIRGKTLLVHAEQGLGDTLQFIRFLPLAKQMGLNVVFECQPPLSALLRNAPFVDCLVSQDEQLPPFDVHCPLLSLPHLLSKGRRTLSAPIPYLVADPARVATWAKRLREGSELLVATAWQGNPAYKADAQRSVPLRELLPLLRHPGVRVVSLQKNLGCEQLQELPEDVRIEDLGPDLDRDGAFLDTAAILRAVDLLVCSDSAIAHLAGGLGTQTFLMLPWLPDWRWGLEGEMSDFYPTMRLFRQPKRGDWASVVGRVVQEISSLARPSLMAPEVHDWASRRR